MKRSSLFFSAVFTLVVTLFAMVSPALAKEPRSIKLVSVNYWGSKGVVFKFEVTGDFSPAELQGFVRISGHEFPLDCSSNDEGLLVCVAGDGIGAYAGSSAIVILNGQGFFTSLPQKKEFSGAPLYCYPIYGLMPVNGDLQATLQSPGPNPLAGFYPAVVGTHCTIDPPKNGVIIDFDHPYEAQLAAVLPPGFFIPLLSQQYPQIKDWTFAIFVDDQTDSGMIFPACAVKPAYNAYLRLLITCSLPN